MDRYLVRMGEMEQSLRIIEQALDKLPAGPIMAEKVPKRIKPPPGEVYHRGGNGPGRIRLLHRQRWRRQALSHQAPGAFFREPEHSCRNWPVDTLVADLVAILGSIDVVMPEIDR